MKLATLESHIQFINAAGRGDLGMVKTFDDGKHVFDFCRRKEAPVTPLMIACEMGRFNVVKYLVHSTFHSLFTLSEHLAFCCPIGYKHINETAFIGWQSFNRSHREEDIIPEYCTNRDCDAENNSPRSALNLATRDSPYNISAVNKDALEMSGDHERLYMGRTALMYAILKGNEKIIKFLLENGADPNIQDQCEYTSLTLAISLQRQRSTINLLIKYGANPFIVQSFGCHWYTCERSYDVDALCLVVRCYKNEQVKKNVVRSLLRSKHVNPMSECVASIYWCITTNSFDCARMMARKGVSCSTPFIIQDPLGHSGSKDEYHYPIDAALFYRNSQVIRQHDFVKLILDNLNPDYVSWGEIGYLIEKNLVDELKFILHGNPFRNCMTVAERAQRSGPLEKYATGMLLEPKIRNLVTSKTSRFSTLPKDVVLFFLPFVTDRLVHTDRKYSKFPSDDNLYYFHPDVLEKSNRELIRENAQKFFSEASQSFERSG